MRCDTFYWVISDDYTIHSSQYTLKGLEVARIKLMELARANPGKKFHLMKRISSCIASDLTFEDSE